MKTDPSLSSSGSSAASAATVAAKKREASKEKDVLEFFYKPHTISAMIFAGAVMVYFAFDTAHQTNSQSNAKAGLLAVSLVFLLFSMLQMRDGIFRRPHPAFWRVVMGVSVLYLVALVYLLFQTTEDARLLMRYIDPKLGRRLPERNYAEHCELYTPNDPTSSFRNLYDTINDEFILAHFVGWFGKQIMLRDASLCWVISILFEIWEMTFEFMLPNFKECWWDHIILDILVCNGLGIYIGLLTCRYMQMKEYDWSGLFSGQERPSRSVAQEPERSIWYRALLQFTPKTYDEFRWDILSSAKRFFAVITIILIFSVVELNAFFLKYLLWIPPPHPLVIGRLALWWLIGLPGIREYYQFVTDPTNKKFGTMAWLCCAIVGVEMLIQIKLGQGEFPNPVPSSVYVPWSIFLAVFTVGTIYYFISKKTNSQLEPHKKT